MAIKRELLSPYANKKQMHKPNKDSLKRYISKNLLKTNL